MGEYADYEIEKMIWGGFESPPGQRRRKTFQSGSGQYKWKQANGQVIDMKDMSVRHLSNALAMCERNGNTGKADDLREVLEIREAEEKLEFLDRSNDFDDDF